jgi:hypothetical protein
MKNRNGFSTIQVLVGFGLTGIISLAMMQSISTQQKSIKNMQRSMLLYDVQSQVSNALSIETSTSPHSGVGAVCDFLFSSGPVPITATFNQTAVAAQSAQQSGSQTQTQNYTVQFSRPLTSIPSGPFSNATPVAQLNSAIGGDQGMQFQSFTIEHLRQNTTSGAYYGNFTMNLNPNTAGFSFKAISIPIVLVTVGTGANAHVTGCRSVNIASMATLNCRSGTSSNVVNEIAADGTSTSCDGRFRIAPSACPTGSYMAGYHEDGTLICNAMRFVANTCGAGLVAMGVQPDGSVTCGALPVNCQGSWGACSASCGGGVEVFTITRPAANGGQACSASSGQTMSCNTQPCPGLCLHVMIRDTNGAQTFTDMASGQRAEQILRFQSVGRNGMVNCRASFYKLYCNGGTLESNPDTTCNGLGCDPHLGVNTMNPCL